ncbi:MAG: hypothetical protein CO029_03735 [Candidatus Magasanikbacteria bacterium CG_4_9_14_0_2_um_filter_41_10]|uniref:Uncharacterized protein n=1 Tax=Candidatus Magasanikbacteria bacterium CG_4_10_14_0_2_um_filter_41_31 TaxID=1974639 RepID=A0A2M7V1Y0_9BACT|nr:MAG: hypothetical protein AUJ37_03630 [Candidatus Magasanikbacteria bacterium CG1_02_41_34]PIZ92399.1 MAG: hypothetical protein COX83_04360 [Candidatus Magasanikbacteria bacterium CG_4_10_14_0_2_um_filter_41_31]PJC53250.1 MAG: hypothetical protein CO029_03735 [Candidatus Magasanikbacteria bacterium CG_4_9_14_0_2_um_filter_41_10]
MEQQAYGDAKKKPFLSNNITLTPEQRNAIAAIAMLDGSEETPAEKISFSEYEKQRGQLTAKKSDIENNHRIAILDVLSELNSLVPRTDVSRTLIPTREAVVSAVTLKIKEAAGEYVSADVIEKIQKQIIEQIRQKIEVCIGDVDTAINSPALTHMNELETQFPKMPAHGDDETVMYSNYFPHVLTDLQRHKETLNIILKVLSEFEQSAA